MSQVNESISISDRVASLVLAAALVITVSVIAAVGPYTALVAASDAPTGAHNAQPAHDPVAESHSNYFPSPVTAPDAEVAAPIATF